MTDSKTITVKAPKSLKLEDTLTEQEAYKAAQEINENDKDHSAKVENGKLEVKTILRG